jgi:hypothetical protein
MTDQDQQCRLRRLSLCDGQSVVSDSLHAGGRPDCYCEALTSGRVDPVSSSELRWLRARDVARSSKLQAIDELRQRLELYRGF